MALITFKSHLPECVNYSPKRFSLFAERFLLEILLEVHGPRPNLAFHQRDHGRVGPALWHTSVSATSTVPANFASAQCWGVMPIIGHGNGDNTSHEPEKGIHRRQFNGLAQVIIQSQRN